MTSLPHTDEVYKEKRKPKNPINFGIQLNEEQKLAKAEILKNHITAIKGKAGSGKTMLAVQVGLDQLFTREIEKLIIARPYVTAGEDIGFLPGGVDDKLSYLTSPIYNIMYDLVGKPKTEKLVQEGSVIVAPFGFLRGNTFSNCYVMIDEAQNATMKQTELMIGRLGMNSKMVFCGDMSQCDLRNKKESGFDFFLKLELEVKGVKVLHLEKNHRHAVVDPILDVFATYRD
jgi:phosphate starvation-inducible protein PhoH and related proteins